MNRRFTFLYFFFFETFPKRFTLIPLTILTTQVHNFSLVWQYNPPGSEHKLIVGSIIPKDLKTSSVWQCYPSRPEHKLSLAEHPPGPEHGYISEMPHCPAAFAIYGSQQFEASIRFYHDSAPHARVCRECMEIQKLLESQDLHQSGRKFVFYFCISFPQLKTRFDIF